MSIFCSKCGTKCPDDALFCHQCGNKLIHPDNNVDEKVNEDYVYNNEEPDDLLELEILVDELLDWSENNNFEIKRKVKYLMSELSSEKVRDEYMNWLKVNTSIDDLYFDSYRYYMENHPTLFYSVVAEKKEERAPKVVAKPTPSVAKTPVYVAPTPAPTTVVYTTPSSPKVIRKNCCPNCGSPNYDSFDDNNYKTSLNLNPLKPFTIVNTKPVKKKKKLSLGKVALGAATGGASLFVTGVKKKAGIHCRCRECGYEWKK